MRDMINYGIYSLSVSTVITFLASLGLAFVGIKEAIQNGQFLLQILFVVINVKFPNSIP